MKPIAIEEPRVAYRYRPTPHNLGVNIYAVFVSVYRELLCLIKVLYGETCGGGLDFNFVYVALSWSPVVLTDMEIVHREQTTCQVGGV